MSYWVILYTSKPGRVFALSVNMQLQLRYLHRSFLLGDLASSVTSVGNRQVRQ